MPSTDTSNRERDRHPTWEAVAADRGISNLGAALREAVGAWVGFLDADGGTIPVGVADGAPRKPVCDFIKANGLERLEGERTTCLDSLRDWANRVRRGEMFETRCHAGLRALVVPVAPSDSDPIGAVYASGYLDGEDSRERLAERLERTDGDGTLGSEPSDEVATFGAEVRDIVESVVRRIAERAEAVFEAQGSGGMDPCEREPPRFEGMVGDTAAMRSLFDEIDTVADSDSSVLIEGENGTGKELVARALHRRSGRSSGRFVALNCAALPPKLVESELFGHRKGAFSGAHRDREGLYVEADGGTLLLDEIGDMQASLQSKLLRFLQEGQFTPVGGNVARSVDVRVVCATNRDIAELVETGEFRKDLYFRLNVVQLRVPPLRERREDIPLLVDHFRHRASREHGCEAPELTESCRRALVEYDWPGNVRELENEIERLVIMSEDGGKVDVDGLSRRLRETPDRVDVGSLEGLELPEAIERLERTMILDRLRETGWNKTRAAKKLGVSRRNLIRKVSDYDLESERD